MTTDAQQINRTALPVPDPTVATNDAVARGDKAERDYVDGQLEVLKTRLDGIDRATIVLNDTINRVPTALQEGLGNLQAVMDERFSSIELQFRERDVRSERESKDNKVAVDAAFAAQKEAAAKQDEANAKAIDKSEKATAETIKTNADVSAATAKGLEGTISDLKERVTRMESLQVGHTQQRQETHESTVGKNSTSMVVLGIVGAIFAFIVMGLAVYAAVKAGDTTPAAMLGWY